MLRRCLSTPRPAFGMLPPPRAGAPASAPGNEFGTMLEIRHVQMLPDGRSLVETWGSYRFRIMERGMLDGYMVGRIERVDDFEEELEVFEPPEEASTEPIASGSGHDPLGTNIPTGLTPGPSEPTSPNLAAVPSFGSGPNMHLRLWGNLTTEQLMLVCRHYLEQMQRENNPWVVEHLNQNYVPMPRDPSKFSFWMALVSPLM